MSPAPNTMAMGASGALLTVWIRQPQTDSIHTDVPMTKAAAARRRPRAKRKNVRMGEARRDTGWKLSRVRAALTYIFAAYRVPRAMASLRDIRKRIRTVKNTRQITKAMKMVSAARLRRAQEALLATRPFAQALDEMMARLLPSPSENGAGSPVSAASEDELAHPLFATRPARKVHLVLFTSDRGLAGGFNANVIRMVSRFLLEEGPGHEVVRLSTVGRKGHDFFKRRSVTLGKDHPSLITKPSYQAAADLSSEWVAEFQSGAVDAVYLVFNEFVSAIAQKPVRVQLLPFTRPPERKDRSEPGLSADDFIFEPSKPALLEKLVPQALAVKVFRALLESVAAEHGARMSAMDNATNNARDIIDALTLNYNRTRQAAITKELMEIVSGAEALK